MPETRPKLLIIDGSVGVTGALVSAARQARLLADEVDTILALPEGHRVPAAHLGAFSAVIELPMVPLRKSPRSILAYLPALVRGGVHLNHELRRRTTERVQINDFYLLHGSMLRLLGFKGRIVTFVRIEPARFGLAGKIWLWAARRSSTELVAVSRFIQRSLGPRYPARLVYEHLGGDEASAAPDSARPVFLFVGNLIKGKGQDLAVAAFNRIAARYPAARLRFVGGDMGLAKNRAFRATVECAAAEGPARDRIEFRGPTENLAPEYREAFAALNFSASESFSITCLDACAAGLPVIATRCGGPQEIVEDGKTGFLVPVGDVPAMADRIAWLLDHPSEAPALGEMGRIFVSKRFSADRAKAALSALLDLPLPA